MPRAKADEIRNDNGKVKTMVTTVGQPEGKPDKEVLYEVPSNASAFQEAMLALAGDTLNQAYADYVDGVRKRIRAAEYEAVASASTWITLPIKGPDGQPVRKNLMEFPVPQFVKAFNLQYGGLKSKADMLGMTVEAMDRGFGAWIAAKKKHVDEGRVTENAEGAIAAA